MTSSSRSRSKHKLEPITLEELAQDSSMTGFTSVFRIPTTEPPLSHLTPPGYESSPVSDTPLVLETAAALETPPVEDTPAAESDGVTVLETPAGVDAPPLLETPGVLDAPATTPRRRQTNTPRVSHTRPASKTPGVFNAAPLLNTPGAPALPRSAQNAKRFITLAGGKMVRAGTAQAAHTQAEQVIYMVLWNALATAASAPYQDVTIGTREIMARTGLSERAVQLNLKTLQLKLAVDLVDQGDATRPKTYRVYSAARTLERRKAAGLEWVQTKQGGGVRLIGDPFATPGVLNTPAE